MPREGFTFRSLEPHDQEFLREALYVALWDPPGQPRRPRSILDDPRIAMLVAEWGRPGDVGFLAERRDSGKPVAAVWIRSYAETPLGEEFLEAGTPHLGIAVLDDYQDRGIGSMLIARALEAAREHYRQVALSVHPQNPARRLYERVGFSVLGTGRGGYLVMRCELGEATESP